MKYIVTHPGKAHRDDFLCACWMLASGFMTGQHTNLFRKDPTQVELDDPEVWVFDCGGRHEPEFRNFDHHQFPADHPPTCAFQLLLETELGAEAAFRTFPWLRGTSLFDSKGLKKVSEHYNAPVQALMDLSSPVEAYLLEQFSQVVCMDNNHYLWEPMMRIGRSMQQRAEALEISVRDVQVHKVDLPNGLVALVADPLTVTNMMFKHLLPEVMDIKKRFAVANGIVPHLSVSPNVDSRGPGWVIYRYDDTPKVDLTRIKDEPKVSFTHMNGFLAKIEPTATLDYVIELAAKAAV